MKKNLIYVILGLAPFIAYYFYNNFFSAEALVGTYVNRNFHYQVRLVDIPYERDTLRLFENNKFSSTFWGNGTYKLKYSPMGTRIDLTYGYEFGKAGYSTRVTRRFGLNPKIILNDDQNHYLEKCNP